MTGNVKMGEILIDHGAPLDDVQWVSPVRACVSHRSVEFLTMLVRHGAHVPIDSVRGFNGHVKDRDLPFVERFLEYVDEPMVAAQEILQLAANTGAKRVLRRMLDRGCSVDPL